MAGYDQKSNVVLSESKERVYSLEEGVEEIPLGLYLVKGDMMCVPFLRPTTLLPLRTRRRARDARMSIRTNLLTISPRRRSILIGEIDEEKDRSTDLSTIRADPIPPIRY